MQITNKQWSEVLKRVRKLGNMSVVDYEGLLQTLRIKSITPEILVISVPDEERLERILSCVKNGFITAISEVLDLQCEVKFEVDDNNVQDLATGISWRITKAITDVMENAGWKCYVEEDGSIEAGTSLNNRLRYCKMVVIILEDMFYIYGTVDVRADEKCFTEVSKFLHCVNAEDVIGCFELDYADGEIRYRLGADCENEAGAIPTTAMLERNIYSPARAFEKYGDALLDVIVGYKTAEEAFEEVNQA